MSTAIDLNKPKKRPPHPFRQALLRGLGVVFPPLLTILIFLWVINTTQRYVLEPVTTLAREGLLWIWVQPEIIQRKDLPPQVRRPKEVSSRQAAVMPPPAKDVSSTQAAVMPPPAKDVSSTQAAVMPPPAVVVDGREYRWVEENVLAIDNRRFQRLDDNGYVTFIPKEVYDRVLENPGKESLPQRGLAYYRRFVDVKYLKPQFTIPFLLALFILLLYLLGKFMAAGIGRFFVHRFEQGIRQLPLVRNVYSSVKQVSDFLFSEREVAYTRVVAVEYPRKGIWSLGFVTSESMLDIRAAANEPVLSLLMPTSPMPLTGFTVTVRKSETIDLNITIEQAFQFIISCGVVVPPQQLQEMVSTPDALPAPADSA
jgi:uncharacterized membrane protein